MELWKCCALFEKLSYINQTGEEKEPAFSAASPEAFYLFRRSGDFSRIDISIHLLIGWTLNCREPSPES